MAQSQNGVVRNIEPKCNTHIRVLAYIFIKPLHKSIIKCAMFDTCVWLFVYFLMIICLIGMMNR
jgi:hypothetical protein